MKHLIVSATALTLLAGSAIAQEATTNPPPAAPAQTAPNQTQTPPPELAPNQSGNQNQNQAPGGETPNDDQDLESSSGMQDQMDNMGPDQRQAADTRGEDRRGRDRWDRDRPRGHQWRGGDPGFRHGRGNDGARFRLTTKEDGGVELDVRCAANEPMQACADIVNGMLDRLNGNTTTNDDDRADL